MVHKTLQVHPEISDDVLRARRNLEMISRVLPKVSEVGSLEIRVPKGFFLKSQHPSQDHMLLKKLFLKEEFVKGSV